MSSRYPTLEIHGIPMLDAIVSCKGSTADGFTRTDALVQDPFAARARSSTASTFGTG